MGGIRDVKIASDLMLEICGASTHVPTMKALEDACVDGVIRNLKTGKYGKPADYVRPPNVSAGADPKLAAFLSTLALKHIHGKAIDLRESCCSWLNRKLRFEQAVRIERDRDSSAAYILLQQTEDISTRRASQDEVMGLLGIEASKLSAFSKMCGGKKAYDRMGRAEKAAVFYEKKFGDKMDAYRCPMCDMFHIGHPIGTKKNKVNVLVWKDWSGKNLAATEVGG